MIWLCNWLCATSSNDHFMNYSDLIKNLLPIARQAGEAIMEIYARKGDFSLKQDGSPVTAADKAAEAIVVNGIKAMNTGITIVSEENPESHKLKSLETFFLVDPLDGTKEFLRMDSKGGFTVNIALIEHGKPVLGIIFAPMLNRMFYGSKGNGAFEDDKTIHVRNIDSKNRIAVASRSHRDPKTDQWLEDNEISQTVSIGSSLKFCLIACGEADIYPRHSPTMEWDTAAGDAILRAAGGMVTKPDGSEFIYGKERYLNGHFIASGLAK